MSASLDVKFGLLDRLASLLDGARFQDLHEALAEEGRALAVEQFEAQKSPYGTPWAPKNSRFGDPRGVGGQIMRNTGRFQNSFVSETTSDGFKIGSNFVGARVLTEGATIKPKRAKFLAVPMAAGGIAFLKSVTVPARPVIPTGEAGPVWGPRLIEVIEDYGAEILGA